jgi:ABC-type xylose transport system permease subunit
MRIERGDGKITLYFERSPNQRAMATLHVMIMGGLVLGLLSGAMYGLFFATAYNRVSVSLFFIACAGLAAWNGSSSLFDPDYTAVFDLRARTVTLIESGVITHQRGPVSFDDVIGVGTRVGVAASHRSVVAELMLATGEQWRLGYELIRVRPASSSEIPRLIAKLRKLTGLPGGNSD